MSYGRWLRTLAHVSPIQVGWRLRREMRQRSMPRLHQWPHAATQRPVPLNCFADSYVSRTHDAKIAVEAEQGRFCLLNRSLSRSGSAGSVEWHGTIDGDNPSRLWLFHLHYFEFGPALVRQGRAALFEQLAMDWVRANPPNARWSRRLGWDSYVISTRLSHWGYACLAGRVANPRLTASAALQAEELCRNLELDVRGNHLIRNCRGLLAAGTWLECAGAAAWRRRAYRVLARHLPRQILSDGGHYERTPMYHRCVLQDLLEARALAAWAGDAPLGWQRRLDQVIAAMRGFGRDLRWSDGEEPLLQDTAGDAGPSWDEIELMATATEAAQPPAARYFFTDSGYARLRRGDWEVIADGGPLCAGDQPAHAHCGLGHFLLRHRGCRVAEDTGVFEYEPGPERATARSTAAHNTLQIDGREQAEMWGSFRMGGRSRQLYFRSVADGTGCALAYRLFGTRLRHHRTLTVREGGVEIEDTLAGRGHHRVEWRLHLAPGIAVEQVSPADYVLRTAAGRIHFRGSPALVWSMSEGEMYPSFNRREPRMSLLGTALARLPARWLARFEPWPN